MKTIFFTVLLSSCGAYELPQQGAKAPTGRAEPSGAETSAAPAPAPQPAPAPTVAVAVRTETTVVVTTPAAPAPDASADVDTDWVWRNPDNGYSWRISLNEVPYAEVKCPKTWNAVKLTPPDGFFVALKKEKSLDSGTYWTAIEGTIGHFVRTIESFGVDFFDVKDDTKHFRICTEEQL